MADHSITVRNALKFREPVQPDGSFSLWGTAVWGTDLWYGDMNTGTYPEKWLTPTLSFASDAKFAVLKAFGDTLSFASTNGFDVVHKISDTLSTTSSIGLDVGHAFGFGVTVSSDITYLAISQGDWFQVVKGLTDQEDIVADSWTAASDASTSWTTATAASTTWSSS